MKTFEQYISETLPTERGGIRYTRTIRTFLQIHPKADTYTYTDIINHLEEIRKYKQNTQYKKK